MSKNNVLMILERSGSNLEINKVNDEYVLEGVFAQFGVENNNNRIYEEKEYLPHLDYLKKKISENRLLGELDHPEKFDISLSKVSHLIEDVKYDPKKRQIIGRIKLLDTPSGQIAKNLVDSGVPVSISSRAAGVVKENKKVEIKRIFTYDLVADPGFENAKLSKVNESFGFSNDDESIAIYEMDGGFSFFENENKEEINIKNKTENNKTQKMDKDFVSIEEMNRYSLVIKQEIEKINDKLSRLSENSTKNEKLQSIEEDLYNLKQYANYLAESQNKSIKFADYLAENLNNSIRYSEHIAEAADKSIQYSEMLAEKLDRSIQYSEMIAENFGSMTEYAEYIARKVDESISHSDYLAEKINETLQYAEYIAEHADNNIQYSEYVAENSASKSDFKNLREYTEYIAESLSGGFDARTSDVSEDRNKGVLSSAIKESHSVGKYSNLDKKIEAVLESVKKQRAEDRSYTTTYPFTAFLSEGKVSEFLSLNEAEKKRVKDALRNKPSYNEEDIVKVWEQALSAVEVNEAWLTDMPAEYIPLWESATNEVKDRIVRQSKVYNLKTPYQIKNFWQTRGLGKPGKDVNESINESKTFAENLNPLGYSNDYLNSIKESLDSKFSR